ncbi:MAG: WG repeat-containing protein [Spirochaetales bacterium]
MTKEEALKLKKEYWLENGKGDIISKKYYSTEGPIGGSRFYILYNINQDNPIKEDGGLNFVVGVMNDNGKEIIEPIYDRVYFAPDYCPLAIVTKGDQHGLISYTGEVVKECKYEYDEVSKLFDEQDIRKNGSEKTWLDL